MSNGTQQSRCPITRTDRRISKQVPSRISNHLPRRAVTVEISGHRSRPHQRQPRSLPILARARHATAEAAGSSAESRCPSPFGAAGRGGGRRGGGPEGGGAAPRRAAQARRPSPTSHAGVLFGSGRVGGRKPKESGILSEANPTIWPARKIQVEVQ